MAGLKNGQTWGNWVLDVDALALTHSHNAFEVELEDMVNSAYVLNWLVDVSTKSWASAEDVGNLVSAIDEIFELQLNICGDSLDRRLNTREHLLTVLPDGRVASEQAARQPEPHLQNTESPTGLCGAFQGP